MSTIPVEAVLPSGRLRVPAHKGERYVRDYRKGWRDSANPSDRTAFADGSGSDAYDDGYLDRATEREKWHLAWCENHDSSQGACAGG